MLHSGLLKFYSVIVVCFLFSFCLFSQAEVTKPSQEVKVDWSYQDLLNDSLPGISLNKAYIEILDKVEKRDVIVAVIDMAVDIDHEDLKDKIWVNTHEIPNNKIDDDNNGYVDDINGWNFLGNSNGKNILFTNYEYTRIVRAYHNMFKDKEMINVSEDQKDNFLLYVRAKKKYDERVRYAQNDKAYIDYYDTGYIEATKALQNFFPQKKYSKKKLDSVKKLHKEDKVLSRHLDYMLIYVQYKLTPKWIQNYKRKAYERIDKLLNLDYDERIIIGDNPNDIKDIGYGNNQVNNNIDIIKHGTKVAGVIAATRNNGLGIDGITDNSKIITLLISPFGNEHDKDVALAIRYAVDNGAKVINISSGKEFSLHQDWVLDAIRYAEKKDVLIVTSAGNNSLNLDDPLVYNFPEDIDKNNKEVASNFVKVGSSTTYTDKRILHKLSNYGKRNVDLFAPGEKILTSIPNNKYEIDSGTSLSCAVVSGVAALIRSCYPDLSASKVKEILMESGTSYDIEVEIEQKDKTKKLVPFSNLSKSGKIVNAYNALLMARKLSLE